MAAILKFGLAATSGRQITPKGTVVSTRRFARMSELLDKVPDVDIDGHGRFKYILIKVQDDVDKASKKIVRGYARAQWHGALMMRLFVKIEPALFLTGVLFPLQRIQFCATQRFLSPAAFSLSTVKTFQIIGFATIKWI
ncbi:uncharacterized protein [Temnothorax nylanderi]|uniref:uncharacterized protein n=1 Tax=Temnothorax nylanderi TaxID=102681 RepID=UPI003A8B3A8F